MSQEWISEVTIDMVPESYKPIAEAIGVKEFIELAKVAGGTMVYIPKIDTFEKQVRNIAIRKEYNGYNAKELALKYDISVTWVKEICQDKSMDGQISLL